MANLTKDQEIRVRKITNLYYSRSDILNAIFEFSKNREICPRYFEGFGKRPDSFNYVGDVFELVKKGATSFNCSEELWEDPTKLSTGMKESELNNLRIGWDLVIDIDCKWFDYAKIAAQAIVKVFENYGIKNVGVKFSGSKGFHIIIPFKAFPYEIAGKKAKDLFPELPRKLVDFVGFKAESIMKESLPEDFYNQFKDVEIKRGTKCNQCRSVAKTYKKVVYHCPNCRRQEVKKLSIGEEKEYKCPDCRVVFEAKDVREIYECTRCNINSENNPYNFSREIEVDLFDLMGLDLVLVSPRHLFRMPYSLHEKTALSSVVIDKNEISTFELKYADPLKVVVKNFMPKSIQGEAEKLVLEALDWNKDNFVKKTYDKNIEFKPVKLEKLSDSHFPPSIQKILDGVSDGRKRSLFILLNLFRSIGIESIELEKRIDDWNKKNNPPLKEGYVKAQLLWAYRNKPVLPPNFDKDFYKGVGVVPNAEELKSKNPVNYVVRKNFADNKKFRRGKEK